MSEMASTRTAVAEAADHLRECRKAHAWNDLNAAIARLEAEAREQARRETWREAAELHRNAAAAEKSVGTDTGTLWRKTVHKAAAEEFERRAKEGK